MLKKPYFTKLRSTHRSLILFLLLVASIVSGCSSGSSSSADNSGNNAAITATSAISGNITLSGVPLPNVSVALAGSAVNVTVSDASGNYSFTGLANGSYDVTPSLTGYTFSPASATINVNNGDVTGTDFTAMPAAVYAVSGNVTFSGSALPGVAVTLMGSQSGSVTTDASGNFTFSGFANGNYIVSPSLAGYAFSPASASVTINNGDVTAVDFTATAAVTYSISGNVAFGGALPGVTMALTGNQASYATTDASGNYTFTGLSNGNYIVTPSLTGYAFSPSTVSITINNGDVTATDFTAMLITYSVSGNVTLSGSALSGVTMTLSGSQSGSFMTDASGNYSFSGLLNGNYIVTPSLAGYTFSPASASITINNGSVIATNFTATLITYSISGNVTLSGAALPGVTMELTGGQAGFATTDASGNFAFTGLLNGNYTVTPSLAGYTFSPASASITINNGSVIATNFTATLITYAISGNVTLNSAVLPGVTMALTGDNAGSAITDASGNFTFSGLANGNYIVSPSLAGYAFSPASASITVNNGEVTAINFTATLSTYSISGNVTLTGSALSGATLALTGDNTGSAITDASGNYTFTGLANGNYTVTPTLAGHTFTPISATITINNGDITATDFTATIVISSSISGNVTLNGVALQGVTVSLAGAQSSYAATDAFGNYTFIGLANGNYTVTPSLTGHIFKPYGTTVALNNADSSYNFMALQAAPQNAGLNWTDQMITANYNDIVYSGSQYVAVGVSGTIRTSPDGITWTTRSSGTVNDLYGVAWSGAQFVAVGSWGTILSSTDGVTWVSGISGTTSFIYDVIWSGTQFITIGNGGILTSPDATTWTYHYDPSALALTSIVWSGTQFVGVGGYGEIRTSLDAVAWSAKMASGTTKILKCIAWSGTQFVAVGDFGTILTSPDGVTWTTIGAITSNMLRKVVWSGTQFVAVGDAGTILTSPDGMNWVHAVSGTISNFYSVVWSGAQFVAVSTVGGIFTSPDGINWALSVKGTTSNIYGVSWSGTQFVAVGGSGLILTSPNGMTWTPRTSGTTSALYSVIWSDAQFVVVGNGGTILTSPDGITWTQRTSGVTALLSKVTWSGTIHVAVGSGSTVLTSPDGITWTKIPLSSGYYFRGVAWSGTQFVLVGDDFSLNSLILTSPDGITWTLINTAVAYRLNGIAWSGTQFVAIGNNGTVLTSPDGISWTQRISGFSVNFSSVEWSGTQFVAVSLGEAFTSSDGITWTLRSNVVSGNEVIWSGTHFVAVGNSGAVFTSP